MGESDIVCEKAKRDKAGYSNSVCSDLTDAGMCVLDRMVVKKSEREANRWKCGQVTIVVLLKKGGGGQVEYHERYDEYSGNGESLGWLEKRMHFLREEMMMVEDRLQRMRQDHATLKAQFHQLERLLRRNQH